MGRGVQLSVASVAVVLLLVLSTGVVVPPPSPAAPGTASGYPTSLSGWVDRMGLEKAGPLPYAGPSPSRPLATDLYVSNLGSNSAACTATAPCRQISEALAVVAPGDTIFVSNGTFLGFDVNTIVATKAAPILIESPGRGSVLVPTVNRSDNRDTVHIEYSDNITLDGLQSYDANRAAVRIDTSDNITVSNCTFGNDTTWGIFTDFDHNSTIVHDKVYGSVQQHGIYVSNSPIAPVVRWNILYNNSDAGLQINADATQGGWGEQSGGDIEDNVIYNNGASGAAGINLDGNINTRVVNNLLYDNHATGIVNYVADGAFGPRGMTIMDNTIVMAPNGRWALQFEDSTGENFVRNNILDNLNPAHGGIEFGTMDDVNDTDSDYNVLGSVTIDSSGAVYTLAQWQAMGYEPHSISATPAQLFVNYLGGDYQLSSTSPAIKAGAYLPNVTTDILGNPRPVGAPSDIGAYQFVSSALTASARATPLTGVAPLTVDFTGGATGGTSPYAFLWSYGDGSPTSSAMDPVHEYNATGTLPVELAVTDATLAVSHAFLNVTVTSVPKLAAVASGAPSSGSVPLTVVFSATISGGTGGDTEFWTFGDGGGASHASDPQHTFNSTGTFVAALRVNDSAGLSAFSNVTITVSAAAPPPLSGAATASPSSGTAPLLVQFNGTATGGAAPYAFAWSFGDGTPVTVGRNPAHTYSVGGSFVATLWVTDAASGNSTSHVDVSVQTAPPPALVVTVGGLATGAPGSSVSFWAAASGGTGGDEFSWNFGDGSGWSAPTASNTTTHVFSSAGNFDVLVWVNDSLGQSARAGPHEVQVETPYTYCSGCGTGVVFPWLVVVAAAGSIGALLLAFLLLRRKRKGRPPTFAEDATPEGTPP